MSIFIVIGIGADDVFVYVDHWEASFHVIPAPSFDKHADGQRGKVGCGGTPAPDIDWLNDARRIALVRMLLLTP